MEEIATPGITRKPGLRSGRPCIEGTGIRVTDIVIAERFGECARDEIPDEFGITREQVAAAFNYYENNTANIDADIQRQFDNFDRLAKAGYGRPEVKILS